MTDDIQVSRSHYEFDCYMKKARWSSVWHQLDEIMRLRPERVLEIGPGAGVLQRVAGLFGIHVETLDVDPELSPNHVGSATALPFESSVFDIVCAFQMLEHLPYEASLDAFAEFVRVSNKSVLVSLPDAKEVWRYCFHVPKLGVYDLLLPKPFTRMTTHKFDGEHYWEVNKVGYSLDRVVRDFERICSLERTFRVADNPYHRFFIFSK